MISRRKKKALRLLAALNTKKPDGTPGRLYKYRTRIVSRKDKQRDGWSTPRIVKPRMKWKEIKEEGLLPQEEYDPWNTYEDGMGPGRFESERLVTPEKVKKQIAIRKAKLGKKILKDIDPVTTIE